METISIDDFELYLTDLCEKEAMNAEQTLDEVLSARALELKGKLTERSPKDTGEYARGWRVRTATVNHEKVKIIYNALRPDLTFMWSMAPTTGTAVCGWKPDSISARR